MYVCLLPCLGVSVTAFVACGMTKQLYLGWTKPILRQETGRSPRKAGVRIAQCDLCEADVERDGCKDRGTRAYGESTEDCIEAGIRKRSGVLGLRILDQNRLACLPPPPTSAHTTIYATPHLPCIFSSGHLCAIKAPLQLPSTPLLVCVRRLAFARMRRVRYALTSTSRCGQT